MRAVIFTRSELEYIDNSNGLERGSEMREERHLKAILTLVDQIDDRDNIRGNDIKINQVRNLANNCFSENRNQLNHNWTQQRELDKKIISSEKNRPPLKAA